MHRSSSAVRWLLAVSLVEGCLATGWRLPLLHKDLNALSGLTATCIGGLSLAAVPVLLHATWRVLRLDRAWQTSAGQASAVMQTLLVSSQEWQWVVDSAGVFTYSSAASIDMVGYAPAELLGQPALLVMDPADLSQARTAIRAAGGQKSAWSGILIRCRHRNGAAVWVDVCGAPLHDATGVIIGFQGTSRLLNPAAIASQRAEHTRGRIETVLAERLVVTAYQPIFTADTGTMIGLEALSRFLDAQTQPAEWFTDAIAVGLGTELELLALEAALSGFTELPDGVYIAVNLSPSACMDPAVIAALDQSPVPGAQIVLELTEHLAVDDYAPLRGSLGALRRRGIRIAVDDAGSGFASFRHILQLAPEIIKLDRELIGGIDTDPARRALASAVVMFAEEIGATVVDEGIETQAELATVRSLGVPAVQGYLLGRPTVDVSRWTAHHPARPATHPFGTDIAPPASAMPPSRPDPPQKWPRDPRPED
jgi:PAS domain S-box-containing protein